MSTIAHVGASAERARPGSACHTLDGVTAPIAPATSRQERVDGNGRFGMRSRIVMAIGTVAALATSACAPEYAPPTQPPVDDPAIVALDIVPAGSFSTPSWADVGLEARMYDSLTPKGANVSDADVAAGFKSAGLGLGDEVAVKVERPRDGLEIVRDRFNVPHITADTDESAIWGVGWASAQHGPVLYEAARRNGRIAAMGVPGGNAVGSALNLQVLEPTAAADAALTRQIEELESMGAEGRAVLADIDAFVAGYNAQLDALLSVLPRWTRLDVIAVSAFKADWWGRGTTHVAWPAPEADPAEADPAEPATDAATATDPATDATGVPTRYRSAKASHFALVSGERSSTGHPLIIGGPQIGYTYPGVGFEVDINSPNIKVRGLTAPAYPGYVFIGRGRDFAWTINVASDAVAAVQFPIRMCGDGMNSYELDGDCVPVQEVAVGHRTHLGNPFGPGDDVTLRSTVWGPLDWVDPWSGTGYVVQRPGLGHDVRDMVAFRAVNHHEFAGPDGFRRVMQQSPQAFYAGYVDSEHIAGFRTCWCATAPEDGVPTVDPLDLLAPASEHPSTVDPPNGVITNWNEPMVTPGGDFAPPSAEATWARDWFDAFDAVDVHTTASLVGAMNGEATKSTSGTRPFDDLFPPADGARPAPIRRTNRSSGIQLVMSFGNGETERAG